MIEFLYLVNIILPLTILAFGKKYDNGQYLLLVGNMFALSLNAPVIADNALHYTPIYFTRNRKERANSIGVFFTTITFIL